MSPFHNTHSYTPMSFWKDLHIKLLRDINIQAICQVSCPVGRQSIKLGCSAFQIYRLSLSREREVQRTVKAKNCRSLHSHHTLSTGPWLPGLLCHKLPFKQNRGALTYVSFGIRLQLWDGDTPACCGITIWEHLLICKLGTFESI